MAYEDDEYEDDYVEEDTEDAPVAAAPEPVAAPEEDDWEPYKPPEATTAPPPPPEPQAELEPEPEPKPVQYAAADTGTKTDAATYVPPADTSKVDDWEPYKPPATAGAPTVAAKPQDDWEPYRPEDAEKPRGLAERMSEGWKGGFGTQPLGISPENLEKYPGWLPAQPFAAGADAFFRAFPGLAGLASGWVAGVLERNPESKFPYGISRAEADRMQRDLKIMGEGLMVEPGLGLAGAHPPAGANALARGARDLPERPPPPPVTPEPSPPPQGQLPFGRDTSTAPLPFDAKGPPQMTQADWNRQAVLAEQSNRPTFTSAERAEYNALIQKEAAAREAKPQQPQIGGGESQPGLPLERPAAPEVRAGPSVQPEIPFAPPVVESGGQLGFNITAPPGRGIPQTTYRNGVWETETTSRPAMPAGAGTAKEMAPPSTSGQPYDQATARKAAQAQIDAAQAAAAAPPPTARQQMERRPYSTEVEGRAAVTRGDQPQQAAGINVLQPGQVDPTLAATRQPELTSRPSGPYGPEHPPQPPPGPPRTSFEPPRAPVPPVHDRPITPIPRNQQMVVRPPDSTQAMMQEPVVKPGMTRLYRTDPRSTGFTTDRAIAEQYGPLHHVDVNQGQLAGQFQPGPTPGSYRGHQIWATPEWQRKLQPTRETPTQPTQRQWPAQRQPPPPPAGGQPPGPPPPPARGGPAAGGGRPPEPRMATRGLDEQINAAVGRAVWHPEPPAAPARAPAPAPAPGPARPGAGAARYSREQANSMLNMPAKLNAEAARRGVPPDVLKKELKDLDTAAREASFRAAPPPQRGTPKAPEKNSPAATPVDKTGTPAAPPPLVRSWAEELLGNPKELKKSAAIRGMTPEALEAQAKEVVARGEPAKPDYAAQAQARHDAARARHESEYAGLTDQQKKFYDAAASPKGGYPGLTHDAHMDIARMAKSVKEAQAMANELAKPENIAAVNKARNPELYPDKSEKQVAVSQKPEPAEKPPASSVPIKGPHIDKLQAEFDKVKKEYDQANRAQKKGGITRKQFSEIINRLNAAQDKLFDARWRGMHEPAEPPAATAAKAVRAKKTKPIDPDGLSAVEFLASKGGISPDAKGDLMAALGEKNPYFRQFSTSLVNKKRGMAPDQARQALVDAGYLSDEGARSGGKSETDLNSLYKILSDELGPNGKRQMRLGAEPSKSALKAEDARIAEENAAHAERVAESREYNNQKVDEFLADPDLDLADFEPGMRQRMYDLMDTGDYAEPAAAYKKLTDEIEAQRAFEGDVGPPKEIKPAPERGADNKPQENMFTPEQTGESKTAQRGAAAPLKPTAAQKGMDEGLFGDTNKQTDFVSKEEPSAKLPADDAGAREPTIRGKPVHIDIEKAIDGLNDGSIAQAPGDRKNLTGAGFCYPSAAREVTENGGHYVLGITNHEIGKPTYHGVAEHVEGGKTYYKDGTLNYDGWFEKSVYEKLLGGFEPVKRLTPDEVKQHGRASGFWPDPPSLGLPKNPADAMPKAAAAKAEPKIYPATEEFAQAQKDYRARKIGDEEFIAAKDKYAAWLKETGDKGRPVTDKKGSLSDAIKAVIKDEKGGGRPEDIGKAIKAFFADERGALFPKKPAAAPAAKPNVVVTHLGTEFKGATIHEAAVFARGAGFKPHQIFTTDGKAYTPPSATAPAGGGRPPGGTGTPPPGATPPAGKPQQVISRLPEGKLRDATNTAAGKIMDIGHEIQMAVAPMARGTQEGMAPAKDFANSLRLNRQEWTWADEHLEKNFTPAERRAMWEAADAESVAKQTGKEAKDGLASLPRDQRAAVEAVQARSRAAWDQARELDMVNTQGLPAYTPRMLINLVGGSGEKGPARLDPIGLNLRTRTGQMKHREHLTAAETEAAGKAKFGEQAELVRDIRTLPLATGKLEDAIAGRKLIDSIRDAGRRTGDATVVEGGKPAGSPDKWFTIDHPSFKVWRSTKGADGSVSFREIPLYVRGEFEGPLRAVLSTESGMIYRGAMELKGKTMSLIMNSPLIHNAVEWGRAMPAMPGKVLTFKVYFEGNRAKKDKPTMREAINDGLVPIGGRGYMQDINAIMESPNLKPGRSWTAQALAYAPGKMKAEWGESIKRGVDTAGDFWHNKLLWDRIGDLQMGLYVNFRDSLMAEKGMDRQSASRTAAHWANRYAGALPQEAMSSLAHKTANMLLFSRSFTMGNLGAMKDMINGLPRDVRAQITRDVGKLDPKAEGAIKSIARRKAVAIIALDVGLMYVMNSALQSMSNVIRGEKTLGEEGQGYADRLAGMAGHVTEHPLSLLQPFHLMEGLSATSENEPGKQDRVMIGYTADGQAIYARNPVGKIGEEFTGWASNPLDMFKKKMSTTARPVWQLMSNDKGFGRKVYDPQASTIDEKGKNALKIIEHLAMAQTPEIQLKGAKDLVTGEGDKKLNALQTFGPVAGLTFSRGAPGGPAMGELYRAREKYQYKVSDELPEIRRMIKRGDLDSAIDRMTELGIARPLQRFYIRTTENPETRLSPKMQKDFERYATPEEKERFRKQLERQGIR